MLYPAISTQAGRPVSGSNFHGYSGLLPVNVVLGLWSTVSNLANVPNGWLDPRHTAGTPTGWQRPQRVSGPLPFILFFAGELCRSPLRALPLPPCAGGALAWRTPCREFLQILPGDARGTQITYADSRSCGPIFLKYADKSDRLRAGFDRD